MAEWKIYGSTGVAKATVKELELHDEWMAECFITISVKSAEVIDFAVGDYIDYRSERYTIEYDPTVLKKARKSTYGEGFVYDNIKFVNKAQAEIVRCDFTDIVLGPDNKQHYTSLPTFQFYCETVDDLLDRIQANLDELYGANVFTIIGMNTARNRQRGGNYINEYQKWIDPTWDGSTDVTPVYGNTAVYESVDNINCWNALAKVHSDFGLNFIVRGYTIIVGTAGMFTQNVFTYGKGNGLYEVEKIGDSEQQIITRLRAYGNETNLPTNYYANLHKKATFFVSAKRDEESQVQGDTSHYRHLVTTIQWKDVKNAFTKEVDGASFAYYVTLTYTDANEQTFTAEVQAVAIWMEDVEKQMLQFYFGNSETYLAFFNAVSVGSKVTISEGVEVNNWPSDLVETDNLYPKTLFINRLMLPGFPDDSLYDWARTHGWTVVNANKGEVKKNDVVVRLSKDKHRPYIDSLNIDVYGTRPGSIYFDGTDDNPDIYPTITGMGVDQIYDADQINDSGVYPEGEAPDNFNITLPNLGFDLDEYWESGASIDMKDGMCGGRSFEIAARPKKNDNNTWSCECKRTQDSATGLWYPYSEYQLKGSNVSGSSGGDHYVLIGIRLPKRYVDAASERLFDAAIEALAKNDAPRFTFQPRIDEIWMQRQDDLAKATGIISLHDTLKAGDIFQFEDEDIIGLDENGQPIVNRIIIDVLTIKENGNNGLPTYEVTLRDEKQVSTIQKIQNKVDSLSFNGNGYTGGGGGGGATSAQIESLIPSVGAKYFLSKITDDIANGIITFVKGIKIGAQKIFGWDENGNILANRLSLSLEAKINEIRSHNNNGSGMFESGWFVTNNHNGHSYLEVDELLVRMKAVFAELEIRKETHSGGNVFYSPAGSVIYRVEYYKYDTEHPGEVIRLGITTVERRSPITAGGKMLSLLKSLGSKIGIFSYDKTIVTEVPVDHSQVDFYRCYLIADDGTVQTRNWWHANDQARCQTFNRASQKSETGQSDAPDVVISEQNNYIQDQMDGNRFYWRLVLKAGSKKLEDGKWYDYVDLSNQDASIGYVTGSDYPVAGDTIVCIGNRTNSERMNLVMLEVIGDDAPAIKMYRGVNSFSFEGKKFWHIGNKLQFRADSIEYVTGNGQVLPPKLSLGPWVIGQRYHYYEEVSHNGSLWLCNIIDGYRWEKADGTFIMDETTPVFADEGTFAYGSNLQFTEHYYNTTEYEVGNEVVTIYLVRKYTTAEPSDNTDSWSVEVAKGEPGHVELTDADKDDIASRVTNLPAGYTLCINPEPIFIDQNEPGLISFYQGNTYYYFADVTVYDHNGNEVPVTINSNDAKAYGRSGNSYVEMRTVPPVVINNSRIALSGIDSHPTTAGAYEYDFDNGYIDFTIVIQKTQEESVTIEHQKVCWYLNQLGSRIVKVVGDMSETYMSKTSYSTDKAQNNAALRTDYEGKITESASGLDAKFTTITDDIATDVAELEITAKGLKSSVTSSNLENLVDNTGWKSWADNSSAIYDADTMKVTNLPNENELYSSAIFLEKNKTYVLSLYTNEDFDTEEGNQVIRFYMCGDDPDAIPSSMLEEPIASPVSTIASDVYQNQKRRYCTIQPGSAEYYKIEVYGPTSFYRAKMERGSVPTSWYATSSEIKQTADEIKLSVKDDLMETGIDITNNTIHMRAENTIIDSDVSVGSLETIGENSRVRIKEGVAEFFGVAGIANIRIGLDSQGCAILNFYDNGGNFVYGLGPNDLPSQLNSKASAFSPTESIVIFDVSSLNNTLSNVSSLAALSSGFATFYLFVEGYSALNNVKTYLVSGTTTPSSYNKKAYDSNGKSSLGDNWHPTGTEITAGYYVGVARANGNYTGSAPSLYKCRDVYYVASTGSPVVFIGTLYYKYDNLKGQLTNMTGTKTYPYNSDRYLIDYLDGNDGERPRI